MPTKATPATARERAHALILKALKVHSTAFAPESLPYFQSRIPIKECHKRLSRSQVSDAVEALGIALNIPGSDMNEGFDLYRLVQTYVLEPEKRQEINAIVRRVTGE
ncbi:MAG TPA: hypothetical protein VI298_06085 [Geobacteraceae bacterium]